MKSPASQARLSAAGSADQVRPPSSVVKTPEGKKADDWPKAQPCVAIEKRDPLERRQHQLALERPMLRRRRACAARTPLVACV